MQKLLLITLLLSCLYSCAQVNKTILKAKAFYVIPITGTIPVDESGTPMQIQRDTIYTLFIEVNGQVPEWKYAWVGNRQFNIIAMPQKETIVPVGQEMMTNKKINFMAKKGNKIWQLELSANQNKSKPPQFLRQGEVVLNGKSKGKNFFFKIPMLTQLASPMYQ